MLANQQLMGKSSRAAPDQDKSRRDDEASADDGEQVRNFAEGVDQRNGQHGDDHEEDAGRLL